MYLRFSEMNEPLRIELERGLFSLRLFQEEANRKVEKRESLKYFLVIK